MAATWVELEDIMSREINQTKTGITRSLSCVKSRNGELECRAVTNRGWEAVGVEEVGKGSLV